MKKALRSAFLAAVLLCLLALGASAQKIDRVVFFGDSLSDSGNHFIYTGTSAHQPFSFGPPDFSYDIGGHHFSNGNTWAEMFAASLKTPTSGNPSLRAPGVFTNYAVGRARARANAPVFPDFDLATQVNRFLADFGAVPDNTLIVIWIGGNDVDDAIHAFSPADGGVQSGEILTAAVTSVGDNVLKLYGAGGRMFMIINVPDFGSTPYVQFVDTQIPGTKLVATFLTGAYDQGLAQAAAGLNAALPTDPVHTQFITVFDANALFGQMLVRPDLFGLSDTTDRCTVPGTMGGAICSNPHQYLFWDGIHPTTTTHAAVAKAALQFLHQQ